MLVEQQWRIFEFGSQEFVSVSKYMNIKKRWTVMTLASDHRA